MITREMLQAGAQQAVREGRFLGLTMLLSVGVGLFVVEPLQRLYDQNIRERPFVTAVIAVVPNDTDIPDILYSASAVVNVRGTWRAWVSINGRRGCSGTGSGSYGPSIAPPARWEWREWFEKNCPVPKVPFALCARYDVETANGIRDISGPQCSVVYDPRSKK